MRSTERKRGRAKLVSWLVGLRVGWRRELVNGTALVTTSVETTPGGRTLVEWPVQFDAPINPPTNQRSNRPTHGARAACAARASMYGSRNDDRQSDGHRSHQHAYRRVLVFDQLLPERAGGELVEHHEGDDEQDDADDGEEDGCYRVLNHRGVDVGHLICLACRCRRSRSGSAGDRRPGCRGWSVVSCSSPRWGASASS